MKNLMVYGHSLLKYAEGGDKTSQYSNLVVILSNWVPDNWVYQLPNLVNFAARSAKLVENFA